MDRNLYEVLGVPRTASEAQIRHAFWSLAKKYHPDVSREDPDAPRKFIEVQNAAETLLDPGMRASYDASLPTVTRGAARSAPFTSAPFRFETGASPPPAPPAPPPPAPPPADTRFMVALRLIFAIAFVVVVSVSIINGVTHPQATHPKDKSNGAPANGTVDWKAADYTLDDGWGVNLGGGGAPRIQIVPGTTADLMVAGGYLSTDGRLALLPPGDAATYQHCLSAIGQSSSQSESLSDITPGARETVCVHGGGGELASIQVTRDDGSNLTFTITVWEYL